MYVCLCKGVTDTHIRNAVDQGADSLHAVRKSLGVASQCGRCACYARDLVKNALGASNQSPAEFFDAAC